MGLYKPESNNWVDQIENLKGQTPSDRRAELKKNYDLSTSQITYLLAVKACFDQTAFNKVRQAQKADPPFSLSLNSAMALAGLKNKVNDLSGALHAALDVTLTRRLATKKIKNLVAWVISGKPAAEFDPKAKPIEPPPSANKALGQPGHVAQPEALQQVNASPTDLDLKKIRQMLEKAEAERIAGKETKEQERLVAYLRKVLGSSLSQGKKDALASEGISETILLDTLADINLFKKIQSRRKKGKSLSAGEIGFLAVHKILEVIGHGLKLVLKLFKPLLKLLHRILKLVKEALEVLGLYKYAKAIFTLAAVVAAIWFACEAFHYGVLRPVEMIWSKIPWGQLSHREPVISASDVPSPGITLPAASPIVRSSELGSSRLKTSSSSLRTSNSPPVSAYQPSIPFNTASPTNTSGTLYDPKILDFEIKSLPGNYVVVKDFPLTPDEGMPVDVAVSRIQDITDPDKYTMMIGGGKQIILSVNPTNTTLTIQYKSADPFGLFGGGNGVMNFLWEDVKYIHANEIETVRSSELGSSQLKTSNSGDVIYQCSLVVSGSKYPLTIQCATAADLEHLVSTMQYFIRHSRLGHDTALGGMPYLHQGLQLNGDCVVEKLWADSPVDRAGVILGDMVWSVEKNADYPPDHKKLEAALDGLQPGPQSLFIASHADFAKAQSDTSFGRTGSLNPQRRAVSLNLPHFYENDAER